MTALARAIAEDCDAPPVLVILPPFEAQRIGNTLLDTGFIPLLLADPLQGLEFTAALDGHITGIVVGGAYPGLNVEAFYAIQTTAYPDVSVVAVYPNHDPAYPPTLARYYGPESAQAVVERILQALYRAQCVWGISHPSPKSIVL
jgi:hypothetical protein